MAKYILLKHYALKILFNIHNYLDLDLDKSIFTLNKFRYFKLYLKTKSQREIIRLFSNLYYNRGVFGGTWEKTFWLGTKIWKYPSDLWVYQEIIYELKPDIIIETGTRLGGSALFLASILDLINKGRVISIDILKLNTPAHKRIKYLIGSSTSDNIYNKIKRAIKPKDTVLIILDSDHHKDHVLKEMELYSSLVTKGSYLIIEDSNVNGHPVFKNHGPGPYEAIKEFLKTNNNYMTDKTKEKFLLTHNPNGFLKRIR